MADTRDTTRRWLLLLKEVGDNLVANDLERILFVVEIPGKGCHHITPFIPFHYFFLATRFWYSVRLLLSILMGQSKVCNGKIFVLTPTAIVSLKTH